MVCIPSGRREIKIREDGNCLDRGMALTVVGKKYPRCYQKFL